MNIIYIHMRVLIYMFFVQAHVLCAKQMFCAWGTHVLCVLCTEHVFITYRTCVLCTEHEFHITEHAFCAQSMNRAWNMPGGTCNWIPWCDTISIWTIYCFGDWMIWAQPNVSNNTALQLYPKQNEVNNGIENMTQLNLGVLHYSITWLEIILWQFMLGIFCRANGRWLRKQDSKQKRLEQPSDKWTQHSKQTNRNVIVINQTVPIQTHEWLLWWINSGCDPIFERHMFIQICQHQTLNPKVHSPPFATTVVVAAVLSTALPGRPSLPTTGFKCLTKIPDGKF